MPDLGCDWFSTWDDSMDSTATWDAIGSKVFLWEPDRRKKREISW